MPPPPAAPPPRRSVRAVLGTNFVVASAAVTAVTALPYLAAALVGTRSRRAVVVLYWVGAVVNQSRASAFPLVYRKLVRGRAGTVMPAVNIEALTEKYGLLTLIVMGESLLAILFEGGTILTLPPDVIDTGRLYAGTLCGVAIAFCFKVLYMDVDNRVFRRGVHAIRWNRKAGIVWSATHLYFHAALILSATGLGIILRAAAVRVPAPAAAAAAAEEVLITAVGRAGGGAIGAAAGAGGGAASSTAADTLGSAAISGATRWVFSAGTFGALLLLVAIRVWRVYVGADASVVAAIGALLSEAGRIDVVVANAGFSLARGVEGASMDDFTRSMNVNCWGALRLLRATLPTMRAQGAGRVLASSSIVGVLGTPFHAPYSASKFALERLFEYAHAGIHYSLVESGYVDTAITTRLSSITGTPPELAPTLRNWKRNDFLPMYARRLTATDVAAHYVRAATDEKPALRYVTTTD